MGAFKFTVLTFLLLGWTTVARAQPLKTAVTVEASAEALDCPQGAALLSAVELILERSLENVSAAEASVKVEVQFFKEADEYRARLILNGKQSGERQLSDSSADCAPLAEAVGVTIALFFDQEFLADPAAATPEEEPAPQAEANSPSLETAPSHPIVRAQTVMGAAFGLGAKPSALLGGEVNIAFGGLQFGAGFAGTLPSEVSLEPGSVRINLLFASLHACYVWGERWAIGPCAFAGVGRMRGSGVGYEQEASENLWWTALGPAFVFRGPFGASERFFWGASGGLWIPTQSQVFSVENVGTAWESPAIQGTLSGNFGVRLW